MNKEGKNLEEKITKILPALTGLVTAVGSYIIFKDAGIMSNPINNYLVPLGIGLLNYSSVASLTLGLKEDEGDYNK